MSETERKPRVFITNDPGALDFTKAEQFGELHRLTVGSVDPFRPHLAQSAIEAMLDEKFDPEVDYILPAGAVLPVAFTFAALASGLTPDVDTDRVNVKLLLFDSKRREYMVRVVSL